MALNLVEASKIALGTDETKLTGVIMELYARTSNLLATIPIFDIGGSAISYLREKTLPNIEFRGLNEGYTEGTGELEKVADSLVLSGGDIDVDTFLVKTNKENVRAIQEEMKIKAQALMLTKKIIKGDVTSDPKEFDGFQVRCTGDNLISAGSSASGDALSLLKLDEAIDNTEDTTHLIMNKTMRRRLTVAGRSTSIGGYITTTLDAFGKQVTMYNGYPILIVDKDESNANIMPFTEAAGTADVAAGTSIYIAALEPSGATLIQNGTLNVRDLGEVDSKPCLRKRIEWYVGLTLMRQRCITRLKGITDAAVTA